MRGRLSGSARGRAAIAVAALYALVLQAFLGALLPVGPGVFPAEVICAEHGGGSSGDDRVPCGQHACCMPARVAHPLPALLPVAEAVLSAPTRSAATPIVWRANAEVAARAPPDPAIPPRGPPAA